MWTMEADLDWPDELLDAQERGDLVVFAGAGISIPSPTCGPTFDKLAEHVASKTGSPRAASEPADVYLGRVADDGKPVHEIVAAYIGQLCKEPNALHRDILRLFLHAHDVRVVTTNFDTMLSQAASDVF